MAIYVKYLGGLGSQLFQYGMGRTLANKYSTQLYHCNSWYDNPTHVKRPIPSRFYIDQFQVHGEIRKAIPPGTKALKRTTLGFDPAFINTPDNIIITHPQLSEQYFKDLRIELLKELTVIEEAQLSRDNTILQKIRASTHPTVSIHIRGRDQRTNQTRKMCTTKYYHNAVKYMEERLGQISLFVFSDDPAYTKSLNLPNPIYVNFNNQNILDSTIEDFQLMCACDHNITSNSTYSWWAAWLNCNDQKHVVIPNRWLSDWEGKSLYVASWKVMNVGG